MDHISLTITLLLSLLLILILQLIQLFRKPHPTNQPQLLVMEKKLDRLETLLSEQLSLQRREMSAQLAGLQQALLTAVNGISQVQLEQLKGMSESNRQAITAFNQSMGEKLAAFSTQFDKNMEALLFTQKERFAQIDARQAELIASNEKKLEQMRETVDEKLQKTLNERLGQSFELVGKQLENVQKGLGEMQVLAQDVGGLKKVLNNVKMRGGLGEVRLSMLLEQILAPDQYAANVKTKHGSADLVEFAIKLPGRDDASGPVYLPVDAKFPQEKYIQLADAYELGDAKTIEAASRELEAVIKKMARDVRDKYIDPPYTTEFGIIFLPFEGVYAEVIRRSDLMEQLQRDYRVVVTGPATLAAMLNSLQMGFRTLAIQKRSGEVWKILGQVKTEFGKFGGLLEKAQKNLHTASSTIDELVGTRTKAIERRLREVEALPSDSQSRDNSLTEKSGEEVGE
ncbi:MAG: DNA recombination protein RmuC [Breznakibacter sp.]